jgi:hypothetical protein
MSPTTTNPLRLASIRICGYRGFPNPVEIRLANPGGSGRSLLLYGENGSGKSTVGKAVRDLLDDRSTAVKFDDCRYRYTDPPRADRAVTLSFDRPGELEMAWTPMARDATHPQFRDMARAKGWLDYRAVWRASEVHFGDSVEIFRPLVDVILVGCQRGASNETFGEAWDRVLSLAEKNPRNVSAEKRTLARLKDEMKQFNDSLEAFLPELQVHANEMLGEFVPWTNLELEWGGGARYNPSKRNEKFSHGLIKLKMRHRGGSPLKDPSEVLNEARLTAIGLCIYLAGMSRSIPPKRADGTTYPRLLILDDVLLSLDMTHRLPLLKVLQEHFKDWQILLLTHDRNWYEIAKQQLVGWCHHELFSVRVGDYEQPVLRQDQDHLYWAMQFLDEGHVKAAAVHVRTKVELVLKYACQSLGLSVKYNSDQRKVPTSDFWSALKSAEVDVVPSVTMHFDRSGRPHPSRTRVQGVRVISTALARRVDHAVSWVLNPLSHSQIVDQYRNEIEEAIFVVDDLETAVDFALLTRKGALTQVYGMIASILGMHIHSLASRQSK